ncbi:hypothetical protein F9U64_06505 [Gracilibacillus oryzae]|uniref:Uncharacterized protein n=2 Tax=Gracilibacillus oryzae TaxID=1672701 RepID=A0A7C8KT42_9BACI|nr:hypothetical protein F9U64_06505 [Gracilibacillus oryzae]
MLLISCGNQSLSTVVDDYDTSQLSSEFTNKTAYEIGANVEGMPIFKNTEKALQQAKVDYQAGFEATAEEFELEPVSHNNYKQYFAYAWQLTTSDSTIQQQGVEISKFFDIYQNSFQHKNKPDVGF